MIMRRNPCHDTDNPPGQINMSNKDIDPNFEFARAQYENDLDLQNAMVYKRLSEVIDKMAREEELFVNGVPRKKISFDEWWDTEHFNVQCAQERWNTKVVTELLQKCWKAAQENK